MPSFTSAPSVIPMIEQLGSQLLCMNACSAEVTQWPAASAWLRIEGLEGQPKADRWTGGATLKDIDREEDVQRVVS